MGKIRSALEIALERTESVKSDKGSIGLFAAKQRGKKIAADYMDGELKSLEEEINKASGEEKANLKQGIFDILVSRITLPNSKEEVKQIESAGRGLAVLIGAKRFGEIGRHLVQIVSRFFDESEQYEEAIKQQYAPKLRQKEEEIARRLGQNIKLDPFQDPEFVAFYNQHMNSLKEGYQAGLDELKEEVQRLFQET